MHTLGKIGEGFEWPTVLGGGVGGVLIFDMPPDYHILQFGVPFLSNGKVFWFKEIPLRRERCAQLNIEGRNRAIEVMVGIPFYVKKAGFTILLRTLGIVDVYIVKQTGIY